MLIWIEAIADIVCGVLDALGGYHWLFARRYILPFLAAVVASFSAWVLTLTGWWIGFTMLPTMGTLCLGYFPGYIGRGAWVALQGFMLGFGPAFFHHLSVNVDYWFVHVHLNNWETFVCYVALCFGYGCAYKDWKQQVGDLGCGIVWGTILFFVR